MFRRWVAVVPAVLPLAAAPAWGQALAPLGYWAYSGNSTSTGSNTTNVVTNTGTVPFNATGVVGTAASFNGSSQFLRLNVSLGAAGTPSGGYALGQNFTMSTWYFVTAQTALRQYVWESSSDYDLSAGGSSATTTTLSLYGAGSGDNQLVTVANGLATGTWHHVTQVYQLSGGSSRMTAYYNGNLVGTTAAVPQANISADSIALGAYRSGTSSARLLNGRLDETAAWSRSLSGGDAMEVYLRGLQGQSLTASTTAINSWNPSGTSAWTTAGNWTGSQLVGQTGSAASTNTGTAIFKSYSLSSGLGIDMSTAAANGALALGAIVLNSSSGTLRIGNSSTTADGVLRLNGNKTAAGDTTLISVAGDSDLVIQNTPSGSAGRALEVRLGVTNGIISVGPGRTATINSVISQATANSSLTKVGNGTLTLGGANSYTGGTTVSAGTLVGTTSSLQGAITNNAAVRFDQAGAGTYAGVLSGSGTLTKTGAGEVTLSGTNTFSGTVTVGSGVLSVASPANLGAASVVNIDGGTLRITGSYSTTTGAAQAFTIGASGGTLEVAAGVTASKLGDQLVGPGNTLTKTGAGTLGLTTSGTSTLGTLNLNAGSLRLTSNRIGSVGAINVASGGTFWIDDTSSITSLTMAAGATLSFAGDGQDGSGAFRHTIAPAEEGNAVVTIPQPISLPSTARFTLLNDDGVGKTVTDTFSGVISGPGGLIKDGTGTMILTGTNNFSGGTTISAGTLAVSADANLGGSAGGVTLGGGRLDLTSGFTLGSGRTITAATGTASTIAVTSGTVSFAGPFTGSGDLDKAGAGTLSLGNASSGYSGTFTISAGTLQITAAEAFAAATLSQTGGTLLLTPAGGGDVVIPELGGSGGEVSVDAGATAVFRGTNNRGYDGRIRGSGAFKKEGNGILTLNADNDFAGPTRIAQGRLKLGSGGGLSATPQIEIDSGAIFDVADTSGFALGTGQRLGGRGTILGDLQFGGGSELAFDLTGPLLVGSGTVSFASGFGIGSIFGLDASVAEGTYTLLNETTGGSISLANLANVGPGNPFDLGGGKSAYFQQGSLQVIVVPEPNAFFVGGLVLALAGLARGRLRRRPGDSRPTAAHQQLIKESNPIGRLPS